MNIQDIFNTEKGCICLYFVADRPEKQHFDLMFIEDAPLFLTEEDAALDVDVQMQEVIAENKRVWKNHGEIYDESRTDNDYHRGGGANPHNLKPYKVWINISDYEGGSFSDKQVVEALLPLLKVRGIPLNEVYAISRKKTLAEVLARLSGKFGQLKALKSYAGRFITVMLYRAINGYNSPADEDTGRSASVLNRHIESHSSLMWGDPEWEIIKSTIDRETKD